MRKALSVFIAVCLVLSLFTGVFASLPSARAAISGDYHYTLAGVITGYTGSGGVVVIPDTLGGYVVTSIGIGAFLSKVALTSVTIPNSVTSIGGSAFYGCTGLTSVTIGSGVTSIGNYAFYNCTGLTSVTIGSGVTSIGTYAFSGCTGLTSVTIPNSVTSIGAEAFFGCTGLTNVTIPNQVTTIAIGAFYGCTGLTSVTIGSGVNSIGSLAFADCSSLTAAYFLGNAPTGTTDMFPATGFTVHYVSGTTDWTNPWYGYPTATSVINSYAVTLGTITRVAGDTTSTVTIDATPVAAGATVTLTVAPKAGMQLKAGTLVATYNGGTVATLAGAGPYTFTMPAYAVSVTAEFEEIPAYAVTFTVTNGTDRIVGAHVTINETTLTTDGSGVATFSNLADGTYAYGVTALGFNDITGGSVTVAGADVDVSVTMTATVSTYTVTFNSQGGSVVSAITGIASGDTVVTLPTAPTKTGYTFASWNTAAAGTGTAFTASTAVTANITVYAQWTAVVPTTYTVTFNSQGGSVVSAITGIASGDTVVTLPTAPTKDGYTFASWNTAAAGTGTAFTASTAVTANVTVYAQWTVTYVPVTPHYPVTPAPAPSPAPLPAPAPVPVPVKKQMVLIFQIGKPMFWDNSIPTKLDSPPIIKNSRTLLPIRAIIEALGGTVAWDPIAHKVTVTLGTRTVVLWIGKSLATVNGVSTPIDATDASVVPEIINSRTMLPLRFVAENLGCTVLWAAATQTITITYTP